MEKASLKHVQEKRNSEWSPDRRKIVDAFAWTGIEDLDDLIAWVSSFGDDYEKWFTLGDDEADPLGPLYIRIPGATIYALTQTEYIVRVSPGLYAPYLADDFHKYYIKKNYD